jgi:hypothetical protein
LSSSRVFPCAAACCSCFLCYCPKMAVNGKGPDSAD